MIIGKLFPFVSAFVDAIDAAIGEHSPGQGMSALQRAWLSFCLTAILVTNSICWARFERASLGTYALAALAWMFRHAKIPFFLGRTLSGHHHDDSRLQQAFPPELDWLTDSNVRGD